MLSQKTVVVPNDSRLAATAVAALSQLLAGFPARVEQKVEAPVPVAEVVAPKRAPAPGPTSSTAPAWLTLGGGAVAMAAGGVLLGSALSFNQAKKDLTFSEAVVARNGAEARLIAGYSLLGAGVLAAGIGTVFLIARPSTPAVAAMVTPGGAAISVSGRF